MPVFALFTLIFSILILQGCTTKGEAVASCPDLSELKNAATQGDIHAQATLGEMYSNGLCMERNLAEARKWFGQAAPGGGPLPKYALANMYHDGAGGPKDNQKAVEWYEKAGQQGLSDGFVALASMYGSGDGVEINPVLAKKYADLAVSTNDSVMKFFAAQMYETGHGAMLNPKQARKWYKESCMKGFALSCKKFNQLNNKMSP